MEKEAECSQSPRGQHLFLEPLARWMFRLAFMLLQTSPPELWLWRTSRHRPAAAFALRAAIWEECRTNWGNYHPAETFTLRSRHTFNINVGGMNAVLGRGMVSGRHGEAFERHTRLFLQPQLFKRQRIARLQAWPHPLRWRACPISTSSEIESTRAPS